MNPAMKPELSTGEALELVEVRPAPRVTKEAIEAKIRAVDYHLRGVLTVCFIEMGNGFVVLGKSAPASPANFDAEVGRRFAYDDAFRQLWALEGYVLATRLAEPPMLALNMPPDQTEEFARRWAEATAAAKA